MKHWIALAIGFALILALSWCAHAECVTSGRVVLADGASHATWRIVDGRKCWFAGYPERKVMRIARPPPPDHTKVETKPRLTSPAGAAPYRLKRFDVPLFDAYEYEWSLISNMMWFSPLGNRAADW